MSVLPANTELGSLEIIEVYDFYDRPVLFSCQNQAGSLFIAVWSGETEDDELWIYAPMSQRRFEQVRSGAIDLSSAFTKTEDGFVYSVQMPFAQETRPVIRPILADTLIQEQLPEPGERLNLSTVTLPNVIDLPAKRALQTRREQIDLSLNTTLHERTEVPAGQLGSVLRTFQHLLNTIGNKLYGPGNVKGSFSQKTIIDMQLNVTGFGAGSFKVNLASASVANLFDETNVADTLVAALELMRMGESIGDLRSRLLDLGARVASAYIEFLEAVDSDITSVYIDWASPYPDRHGDATISADSAQRLAKAIRSFEEHAAKEYEVTGILIGANLRTMKFEVEVGESSIAGDIDEAAQDIVNGISLGGTYIVQLREVEIFRPMTDDVSLKFYLAGLRST